MLLSEYIEVLKAALVTNGDAEVAMTQSGYYSDGMFAELYDVPEFERVELGRTSYWDNVAKAYKATPSNMVDMCILGHSHQSY